MPETRSTTEALATMSNSITELLERMQAVELKVQNQAEENAKSTTNMEQMMAQMMSQLQDVVQEVKNNKQRPDKHVLSPQTSTPILATPSGGPNYSSSNGSSQHANQIIHNVTQNLTDQYQPRTERILRIDVPMFTGEAVEGWVFQMERYFEHHHINWDQRIAIAVFYLSGEALKYYQYLHATRELSDWSKFVKSVVKRFGPPAYWNAEVALNKLQHNTTVSAYITEFEDLATRTPGLSSGNLLNRFLAGLKDEVHRELVLLCPDDLQAAMGMARIAEQKILASGPWQPRLMSSKISDADVVGQKLPSNVTTGLRSSPESSLPFKRLTMTEMAARRERGLCFNCDEKFVPGHRCKPKFQCLWLEEAAFEEESVTPSLHEEEENYESKEHGQDKVPNISYLAMEGRHMPSTICLKGQLNGSQILVLVDGGSTHNFLQTRIARHAGFVVEKVAHLNVTIGNGEELHCEGLCRDVKLRLGTHTFFIDFYILPIYGADAVLGAQWLSELGSTTFNYKSLWMSFEYMGKTVVLQGIQSHGQCMQLSLGQLKRMTKTHAAATLYQIVGMPKEQEVNQVTLLHMSEDFEPTRRDTPQLLLNKHALVFSKPKGLHPVGAMDHILSQRTQMLVQLKEHYAIMTLMRLNISCRLRLKTVAYILYDRMPVV